MLPGPFAAAVLNELSRLNEAELRLAMSRDLPPAEKRRRAGHIARRRRELRLPSPLRPGQTTAR